MLTEENLKQYLGLETEKINLEHHYWLKESFIDKIGRMAPNLRELSLRRLKVSNHAFTEIVLNLKKLERIDVSDCPLIHVSAMRILLDNNRGLKQVQCSNISNAINDEVVQRIAKLDGLTFLDMSYATQVTDHGMSYFKDKNLPISKLFVNGLTSISTHGLSDLLSSCKDTLKLFEAALMNQESMNGAFCSVL